ncbi:MAG: PAS domain S-box protein [Anaerolineae bacterium]|nr:PAS domain S-box protein [Anaerolineae bacterium]
MQFTAFAVPLAVAAAMCFALGAYGWRRASYPGANSYALSMVLAGWWSLGYALELASADAAQAELFARLQYLGIVVLPVSWLAFSVQYTGGTISRREIAGLLVVPALTLAMLATNDYHGLIWDRYRMVEVHGLRMLEISRGGWFWFHTAYSYALLLLATVILVRLLGRSPRPYRGQALVLLVALLAPFLASIAYLAGLRPLGRLDLTGFMFVVTGLAMLWGMGRFHLLDIVPIASAAVIESMADGMLVLDRRRRLIWANPSAERLLGAPAATLLGRPIGDVAAAYANLLDRLKEGKEGSTEVWLDHQGRRACYDLRLSELLDDHRREPRGLVVTLRDVTAARRAQEALARSEARYRSIFDTAPSLILSVRGDGTIASVNRRTEPILGYRPEEIVSRRLEELVHPDDWPRLRRRLMDTLDAARPGGEEYRMLRKDGRAVPVHAHWAFLPDEDGPGAAVHLIEDLTERRRLEAQYRQAQKMEAVGQLAGGIAHDFNNLLTVISGHSDFLREELAGKPALLQDVEGIRQAGERAALLTRQLLAFSRRQVLEVKVMSLNEVIAGMASMLARTLGEQIALEVRLADDLWHVRADRAQIEQVVLNLALNARDAMPEGGTLTLETANVELDAGFVQEHLGSKPGPHVRLSVEDTGVGMPPEVMAHLFEPFFSTKGPDRGTGMGLASVYGIIKQLGGNIYVESQPGQGTSFRIYLARAEEPASVASTRSERPPVPRGTETILVVEDEKAVRALASSALRRLGYTVLEAAGAEEAMAHWRHSAHRPDLVLTDVVMPGMNGPELVQALRATRSGHGRPADVPVLYMTGYCQGEGGSQSLDGHVMQKPFDIGDLSRTVRRILDGGH